MKKGIIILIILIVTCLVGVLIYMNVKDKDTNDTNTPDKIEKDPEVTGVSDELRIKLTVNNEEMYVKLNDSVISRDFLSMLPMTIDMEDYNSTEKIGYLERDLNTEGSPNGYTPQIGDFSYYAPWGNLSIFYREFRYSNSLIKLGEFESGIEILENINGDFELTIEEVTNE